jgi:hypothetical protein
MIRLVICCLLAVMMPSASAKSLAGSVDIFAYPSEGQSKEQQEQDDYQCFTWARDQTGFDPINARAPDVKEAKQPAADGSRARGALRGATRGAILGEVIDDDAGKGAEIGATIGAMRARREAKESASSKAAAENLSKQDEFTALNNNFREAMSLCLEARGYAVN